MTNNIKYMINIFGPSTAGKSTVSELLQDHIDQLYTVDFDVIKRQISGYYWKRDSSTATEITYDTLNSVAKLGLPILILLPLPKDSASYERIATAAVNNDYKLLNIEITAPQQVLIERYQNRLKAVQESGTKWTFKTLDEFKAKLEEPYYRPDNTITFDSSTKSPDEIFNDIQSKL